LATLPQRPQYVRIIGCEPASLAEELGLTPTVAAAVPLAASLVLEQIAAWTHDATKKGGDVCSGDS
ncbi:MAG: hypothetical protein NZL87_09830, partial [Thermomicrobium sp.]|nr:hypothetical protein [Thermomicrobium sp.]